MKVVNNPIANPCCPYHTQMNTSHLVRIVFFVMLGVNLSSSSPLERLKRLACPPGIWTCLYQKHDSMDTHPEKTIARAVPLNNPMSAAACPPGIWTCATLNGESKGSGNLDAGLQAEGKQISVDRVQSAEVKPSANSTGDANDELNETNGEKCPPGIWVCKKKRSLKKRMKKPNRVQRSARKCPPGIWVC